MANYKVHGKAYVDVYVDVEADSAEEAIEVASNEISELISFVGNGGYDKLVGVYVNNQSIEPCGTIEYEDVQEL